MVVERPGYGRRLRNCFVCGHLAAWTAPEAGEPELQWEVDAMSDFDAALRELGMAFAAKLPGFVEEMKSALESGDIGRLQQRIHKLAGTAGMYGFGQVSTSARSLERAINDSSPGAKLAELLAVVESDVNDAVASSEE